MQQSAQLATPHTSRRFKFSGRIAADNMLHRVVPGPALAAAAAPAAPGEVIPPTYVYIPGIGNVPQYAPTVASSSTGYSPAQDCNGYFMSFRFQPNNNCYNYSCNIASNSFAQPGRRNGYAIPDPPTGPGVQAGAQKDGLIFVGTNVSGLKGYAANAVAGGHYVALLISQADTQYGWPGDYHWVRCDDNVNFQSWSQKDGNDQVTNFDFAGNPIRDPATANWAVNQGPISQQNPDDL